MVNEGKFMAMIRDRHTACGPNMAGFGRDGTGFKMAHKTWARCQM